MNNEEKILGLLEKMDERQNKTDSLLEAIQSDIAELKEDTRTINQRVAVIEVEHSKKLNALVDGYKDLNRKADTLQATVDDMAPTVTALDVLHHMRGNKSNL